MEQSLLDGISSAYGLSKLVFLREPEHGLITKNAIVSDVDNNCYFIKNFRASHEERIACIENSAQFVAKHSAVPVVLPLSNERGEFHTTINGNILALYSFIEGEKFSPQSLEQEIVFRKTLGATLGMIHGASRGQVIPEIIIDSSVYSPLKAEEALTALEEMKSRILKKERQDEYDEKALSFINLKISLLQDKDFSFKGPFHKDIVVCHGDLHNGNLLFDTTGTLLGVCDWDHAGRSSPYNDLLRAVSFGVLRGEYDKYHEKTKQSKAFIQGYLENGGYEFNESDIEYAIDLLYQKLITSLWPMSDHYDLSHTKTDHVIDWRLKELVFLRDNRASLLKLIMSYGE